MEIFKQDKEILLYIYIYIKKIYFFLSLANFL